MKEVIEGETIKNQEDTYRSEEPTRFRNKVKEYSRLIQQTFQPSISLSKKEEIELKKKRIPNDRFRLNNSMERTSNESNVRFL